jgi:hypothetical protein
MFGNKRKRSSSNVENLDALDPRRMRANLPTEKVQFEQASKIATLADDTKRRGAGGTKSGLVGIRPSGSKAFEEFHETFTETGKRPVTQRGLVQFHGPVGEADYRGPKFKVIAFPETFCILCTRRDVKPGEGMLNIHPVLAPWPQIGLVPGDVIRCVFCKNCTKKIKKQQRSPITMVIDGQQVNASALKAAKRFQKMSENIEAFLIAAWNAQTPGMFADGPR